MQSAHLQNQSELWAGVSRARLADATCVVVFAAALALSAQVRFYLPGSAVPVTMQTLVVLLCGYWLRPSLAAAAVGLYLAAGFFTAYAVPGLALFALFAAGNVITLGYLFGFLAAAWLVSAICARFSRLTFGRALAVGVLGTAVIFACGVTWLAMTGGSLVLAVQQGLAPFAAWAAVKTGLAAALASAIPLRR